MSAATRTTYIELTVIYGNKSVKLEVERSAILFDVCSLIEATMEIGTEVQELIYQGKKLTNYNASIESLGIVDNCSIHLLARKLPTAIVPMIPTVPTVPTPMESMGSVIPPISHVPQNPAQYIQPPPSNTPINPLPDLNPFFDSFYDEQAQKELLKLNTPEIISSLVKSNPELADAILNNDVKYMAGLIKNEVQRKQSLQRERQVLAMDLDPLNLDNQRRIEELLNEERVQENKEFADEHMPELNIRVDMLYINCSMNNIVVQAFIDTGAQSTIMSKNIAEKCNLMKMLDRRQRQILSGVGSSTSIGVIHAAEIEIGGQSFTFKFTVIDTTSSTGINLLIGLDNLRRHRANIDLFENRLTFRTSGVRGEGEDISVPFLTGGQIEKEVVGEEAKSEQDKLFEMIRKDQEEKLQKEKERTQQYANTQVLPPIPSAPPQTTSNTINQHNINTIVSNGFTTQEAIAALQSFNGNLEMALSYLIQEKQGFNY